MDHEHSVHSQQHNHDKHAGHNPDMFKQKFWISFLLTVPTVIFSPSVQSWLGIQWRFGGSEYIPAVLGIIIFFYGGLVFLKSAKIELANRQPGMMTLISMAITVAFGYSLASTLKLVDGMDFWWELVTLVTIMLLGHWLEMASIRNAEGALGELAKLLPDSAELLNDGKVHTVAVSDLKIEDVVLIRPGAKVPVDGVVIKGESAVDESMLTGESKPIKKTLDMEVIGGTVNGNGSLTVRITRVGNDTTLAGIMKLVSDAQTSKSKTQVLADKAAFYLTFAAIGAAGVTAVAWTIAGESIGFILERVVTVLVIACPHALGLAIPLVTAISTTKAAKNGILVRQRMALESSRLVDVVLFDKTGTLTKGSQAVIDIWPVKPYTNKDILHLAASLEQESEHAIGGAIIKKAKELHIALDEVKDFASLPGLGIKGILHGNEDYLVASRRYVDQKDLTIPVDILPMANQAAKASKTVVYVIKGTDVIGAIGLADEIRQESRKAIAALKRLGITTAMITGDSREVAEAVARELKLDVFFAEVSPQGKAQKVKTLQQSNKRVAMVGDGVNDAPALVQADVGIAIGAGTDVAVESAGIVLASNDPRGVVRVLTLSKATYRKMIQNLAWATGYNVIAIPLAAGISAPFGFVLSPALGAVLMSLSTIIVALNAQLLRKVRLS